MYNKIKLLSLHFIFYEYFIPFFAKREYTRRKVVKTLNMYVHDK